MSKNKSSGKSKKDEPATESIAVLEHEFKDGIGSFIFPDNSKYEGYYVHYTFTISLFDLYLPVYVYFTFELLRIFVVFFLLKINI